LAIFDTMGTELTRQDKCPGNGYLPERAEEMVCPIEGPEVSFITGVIPWEIEASQEETSGRAKNTIYRHLKKERRYVAIASPKAKPAHSGAKP